MGSKMLKCYAILFASVLIFQMAESVLFTVGGVLLDSSIAFAVFSKFMYFLPVFGKRDVSQLTHATPNQYLTVATSIDTDHCLPFAVCVAMAKSRDVKSQKSQFEELVIDTFQRKIKDAYLVAAADRVSPLSYYVAAAKFGQTVGVADECRMLSPTCTYSIDHIRQLMSNTLGPPN
ncbi:hypothetical protein CHUAL_010893 [Chamberlinius hualienensis]